MRRQHSSKRRGVVTCSRPSRRSGAPKQRERSPTLRLRPPRTSSDRPAGGADGAVTVLASPASAEPGGNPYVNLLYAVPRSKGIVVDAFDRKRALAKYDIIHVNWPGFLVRFGTRRAAPDAVKVIILLALARVRGTKIAWTIHELKPHDEFSQTVTFKIFYRLFRSLVNHVFHLSPSSKGLADAELPDLANTSWSILPHGHYRSEYPNPRDRGECRRELGMPEVGAIALAIGQVRPYKRIAQFARESTDSKAPFSIAVAGMVTSKELRQDLEKVASTHENVHLHLASLSPEEMSTWIGASDVLVLPYAPDKALHSGVALLGLSLDRGIVVVDSGPMRDLQTTVGPQWVHLSGADMQDLVRATEVALREPPIESRPDLQPFDWDLIGSELSRQYKRLSGRDPEAPSVS